MREYHQFAEDHFKQTGFRYNGEIFSIDPINAPTDLAAWSNLLKAFHDFAYQRHGIPLLDQSPCVERKHCDSAYGERWTQFSNWVREVDPERRMLNPFFEPLLTPTVKT